jgi:hypothetical protein
MQTEAVATSLYDPYLPYLPEKEELNKLDGLLAEMVAKAQDELGRLAPKTQQE